MYVSALQCSYYPPCKTNRSENIAAVERYAEKYGTPGNQYDCLYNPENHAEVLYYTLRKKHYPPGTHHDNHFSSRALRLYHYPYSCKLLCSNETLIDQDDHF